MNNPVEQLRNEYKEIGDFLLKQNEVSLLNDLNKHFRKILILSAGSYFEYRITFILSNFAREKSNGDIRIINFLEKQAINQRYFSLFSWGEKDKPESPGKNANAFFRLFGNEFGSTVEAEIKENNEIEKSIRAFLEIGHLRNILVHSNFAEYVYEQKTPEEIFTLFKTAEPFLDYLMEKLK